MANVRHNLVWNLFHLDVQTNMFMAALAVSTLIGGHGLLSGESYSQNQFAISPQSVTSSQLVADISTSSDIYQKLMYGEFISFPAIYKEVVSLPVAKVVAIKPPMLLTTNAKVDMPSKALTALAGPYAHDVKAAALSHHMSPRLIASVVYVETTGRRGIVVSKSGAIGPMQLMPETARKKLHVNPWNPAENINGGTQYLSELVGEFKSVKLALIAYNEGPAAVMRGHYSQNSIHYADKILALAHGDTIAEVKHMES